MTAAIEGGWAVSSTPWPHFTPRGKDTVPILQEAGWVPGPVWTGGKSRPHRDSILTVQSVVQSLYLLSYRAHACYNTSTHKSRTYISLTQPILNYFTWNLSLLLCSYKDVNSLHGTNNNRTKKTVIHPDESREFLPMGFLDSTVPIVQIMVAFFWVLLLLLLLLLLQ